MSGPHLAALYAYPIKSGQGLRLSSARLHATGIENDREWLIVDDSGRFVTQREQPRLATLKVQLQGDELRLLAPEQPTLTLARSVTGKPCRVRIWRDECAAFDAGDAAAAWLSTWLCGTFRLVRFDRSEPRYSACEWTGETSAPNLFSDGYPLLVLSQASLDDLAARTGRHFPVERFRPNLLLDGVAAYAEDQIDELTIGPVRLRMVKPCTRCIITTTDPRTGSRDGDEPLRTLRGYRHDVRLQGATFGYNAIVIAGGGAQLNVGQAVSFTLRRPPT